jgi:hypothetical protein
MRQPCDKTGRMWFSQLVVRPASHGFSLARYSDGPAAYQARAACLPERTCCQTWPRYRFGSADRRQPLRHVYLTLPVDFFMPALAMGSLAAARYLHCSLKRRFRVLPAPGS